MTNKSPLVSLSLTEALAQGWAQTSYAVRDRCVSCPCCDTLICSVYRATECHGCGWKTDLPVDRERPSIHNGKPRLGVHGIQDLLRAERDTLVTGIFKSFTEMQQITARAHEEHLAGNLPEARILLNEALDIECDVTGDTKILSPLAEEWEVDYERDQRKPTP